MSRRSLALWIRWTLAILGTLAIHVGLYVTALVSDLAPFDVQLELETDLEFGYTELVIPAAPLEPGQLPTKHAEVPAVPSVPPGTLAGSASGSTGPDPDPPPKAPDAAVPEAPDAAAPVAPDAAVPAPASEPEDLPAAAPGSEDEPRPADASAPPSPSDAGAPAPAPDAGAPPSTPDAGAPPSVAAASDAGAPPSVPPTDAGSPPSVAAAAASEGAPSSEGSGSPADAGAPASVGAATSAPTGLAANAPAGAVALPAGAQIALRIDLAAIRVSPLAEDVRGLLGSISDWQRLLDGSGVDPLTALDRVLIASPSLRRDRMVLAGALSAPNTGAVQHAVQSLAAARGTKADWSVVDGRPVAPWANVDATARHVAILDPTHFAIARLEDLPTVLALAQAREDARHVPGEPDAGPRVTGPETLLWLPPGTVVSGEVEGVRRLLRGGTALVPERLRVALVTVPGERVLFEAEVGYPNREEAAAAFELADVQRRRLAADPLTTMSLSMMGLVGTLDALRVEIREETRVYASVELSYTQVRAILTRVRAFLEERAQRRATSGASPSAPSKQTPASAAPSMPTPVPPAPSKQTPAPAASSTSPRPAPGRP